MRAEEETANHNGQYPMAFALPLVKISGLLGRNPEDLAYHEWVEKTYKESKEHK